MKPGQYWTATWSPVSGCTPVSEGCANCFAKDMARRFPESHAGYHEVCESCSPNDGGDCGDCEGRVVVPFSQVVCHPDRLDIPLHWRKPRRVLVCSMGDLFHPDVPDGFQDSVFDVIRQTPQHTYWVLTKRPERMRAWMLDSEQAAEHHDLPFPWSHVYLGVSVEDQATADERIPILLDTPAAHRWVSVEPALSWIDFNYSLDKVDAVIWGCKSGPRRRPAPHDWARHIRSQCQPQKVPFFLKQASDNEDGTGKVVKMPELDGRVWDQLPEGMVR